MDWLYILLSALTIAGVLAGIGLVLFLLYLSTMWGRGY